MPMSDEKQEFKQNVINEIGKKNYIDFDNNKIVNRGKSIGKILKFLRNYIDFTQKEIAQKIGVAQQTYAGYETQGHEPSIEILIRLADIYGVTLDYIAGRFAGNAEAENMIEVKEMNETLEYMREHYKIQRQSDLAFLKMIRNNG